MTASQVQAAKADDLGAQAVAKDLGGLPVVADDVGARRGRCGWCWPTTTPGRAPGLGRRATTRELATMSGADTARPTQIPAPSPILTAGSDDPECVN